jgi:hypothetical protein
MQHANDRNAAANMKKTRHAEMLVRFTVPTPLVQERMAAHEALRGKVPHDRHAEFSLDPKRPDPAVAKVAD